MKKALLGLSTMLFTLSSCTTINVIVPPQPKTLQTLPNHPQVIYHQSQQSQPYQNQIVPPPLLRTHFVLPPEQYDNYPRSNLLIDPKSPPTTYGPVSILGLNLNNQSNNVHAQRGQTIPGTLAYRYDCPTCKLGSVNQIIIGIAGQGAQACIYNGTPHGQGIGYFNLKAPNKPGVYSVRVRYAQAYTCEDAIKSWWNTDKEPSQNATIGSIIVN